MEKPQRLVFGSIADEYEAHRPTYPRPVIDNAIARAGGDAAALDVLDIGAGTGRVADLLHDAGVVGTMLEPDDEMAAVATAKLGSKGWTTIVSDFESAPIASHSIDLITCGQAWHWVDPVKGMQKAVDVLRPGGWLTLIWNRPTWHDDALRSDLTEIYTRLVPDMRSSMAALHCGHKGEVLDTEHPPPGIANALVEEHWHTFTYDSASWLALLRTHSDHVMMDDALRAAVFAEVAAAIERHGGSFELPHRTEVWAGQTAGR